MRRQLHATRTRLLFTVLLAAVLVPLALWGMLARGPFDAQSGLQGPPVGAGASELEPRERADAPQAHVDQPQRERTERPSRADSPVDPPVPELPTEARGSIAGTLLNDDGEGLEGIPVHLSTPAGRLSSVLSGFHGRFDFAGLEDGRWILRVGSRLVPWVPAIALEVSGTSLELEPLRLPPLGSAELRVVDSQGAPVPRVRVYSAEEYELVSDAHGLCLVSALPEGIHRFYARDELLGRGNVVFEVGAGSRASATIVLKTGKDF